jgi:exo-1,4-beta-D-glucosaminidase
MRRTIRQRNARWAAAVSAIALAGDNELQSPVWQGSDITLFPVESQTLTVTYGSSDLGVNTPVIAVSGWNVPQVNIPAPVP